MTAAYSSEYVKPKMKDPVFFNLDQTVHTQCSILILGAMINTMTTGNFRKKGFISLREARTDTKAETWRHTIKWRLETNVAVDLLPLTCSLYILGLPPGIAHHDPGSPTSLRSQENCPQTYLQVNLMETIPQLSFPHPRYIK